MTMSIREQFNAQIYTAKITAMIKGIELDIVMVTHPDYDTRISIIGNAINRAAYEVWKNKGCNVRKLCIVDKNGKIL